MRTTPRMILILKHASSTVMWHKTLAQKMATTIGSIQSIMQVPLTPKDDFSKKNIYTMQIVIQLKHTISGV